MHFDNLHGRKNSVKPNIIYKKTKQAPNMEDISAGKSLNREEKVIIRSVWFQRKNERGKTFMILTVFQYNIQILYFIFPFSFSLEPNAQPKRGREKQRKPD